MSVSPVGEVAVLLAGAALGRWAPSVALAAVLVFVPWRFEVFADVNLATLLLVGASLSGVPRILPVLRQERLFLCATLAFPAWAAASVFWGRQPAFVWPLVGKWLTVVLAAWLAAADRTRDPRAVAGAAFVAMVPHAVWALLERLHVVRPLGDPALLRFRLIDFGGNIRGRGLFWHPNRLGEFVEQVALLLAGIGLYGVWTSVCLLGVAAALAGVWGTGSTGSMAALGGGLVLMTGWIVVSRWSSTAAATAGRRRAWTIGALALAAAAAVGVFAYWSHGGLGPRSRVYRFAWQLLGDHPVLGIGAGHWSLAVGGVGPDLSQGWFRGHAHSLLLHVGAELGWTGMVLVTFFFAGPLWIGVRRFGSVPEAWRGVGVGAAFGAAALFAHNLVHYFLRDAVDGIVTGLLLGTVVAVARRAPRTKP